MPMYKGKYMTTYAYVTMCEANYAAAKFEQAERERFEAAQPQVDYTNGEGGNATPLSALLTVLLVVGAMVLVALASVTL